MAGVCAELEQDPAGASVGVARLGELLPGTVAEMRRAVAAGAGQPRR